MLFCLVAFLAIYRSSPGNLTEAHTKATGVAMITNCRKCHTSQGLTPGCLHCHLEIQSQLNEHKGFHNFILKGKTAECASCHSDHNGKTFNMINKKSWKNKDEKDFAHEHVNYILKGKHNTLTCDQCHVKNLKTLFVLKDFPTQQRATTKLGLSQNCASCHKDPHANGLSPACEKCHNQDGFKITKPLFDHDKFYPLAKGHVGVACYKCHVVPADAAHMTTKSIWAPFDRVKGKTCESCHSNPHRTDWKKSCESCHNKDARPWREANRALTKIDHLRTTFPLKSPHQKVTCAGCHPANLDYQKKYPDPHAKGYMRTTKMCEGCHQDQHQGQFSSRYPRCLQCHAELGFKPHAFTVQLHQKTSYPLAGKHVIAKCNSCHTQFKTKNVRLFAGTPTNCAACHKDIHRNQFKKNGITTCENCHQSTASWKKITFDHDQDSRYKLDDAHKNVACRLCHIPLKLKSGEVYVPYKPLKSECKDCHRF